MDFDARRFQFLYSLFMVAAGRPSFGFHDNPRPIVRSDDLVVRASINARMTSNRFFHFQPFAWSL